MSTEQTEPLTNAMIATLEREAAEHGDFDLAQRAAGARGGVAADRAAFANAINDARGMDDSKPFVRVVP